MASVVSPNGNSKAIATEHASDVRFQQYSMMVGWLNGDDEIILLILAHAHTRSFARSPNRPQRTLGPAHQIVIPKFIK